MRNSLISQFFYAVTSFLEPRKKIVLLVAGIIICLAGVRFYNTNLDLSIASLLPDSSKQLSRMGQLLDINPSSRVMMVEFSAVNDSYVGDMEKIAAALDVGLSEFMEEDTLKGLPLPGYLLQMLPYVFDQDTSAQLQGKITPEAINESVLGVHRAMSGLYGFAPKEYLRSDPLGFLSLFSKMVDPDLFQGTGFDPSTVQAYPVSADGKHLLLVLRPKSGMYDAENARDIMLLMEGKLKELLGPYDGKITTMVVGGPRYTAENAVTIERDLKLTISLSILFLAVIYLVTVRSLGIIWLMLTPVVAVVLAGSAMSLIWPQTAGLALGFGAAVLGMAEDYAVLIHFGLRRQNRAKPLVVGALARPMVFSASLCMSSFLVLLLSGIPALRQLGFFASCSLLVGLTLATIVLPYCPWMDKPPLPPEEAPCVDGLDKLNPNPITIIALWVLLLVGCAVGLQHIPFDSSVQKMGVNTEKIQAEIAELRSHWTKTHEPLVWTNSASTQDAALTQAAELAGYLRQQEGNLVFSLADILPPMHEQKKNIENWRKFMTANGESILTNLDKAAAANGFKPSAFKPFTDWLRQQLDTNFAAYDNITESSMLNLIYQAGMGDLLWWMSVYRDNEYHVLTFSTKGMPLEQLPPELGENTMLFSVDGLANAISTAFNQELTLLPIASVVCFILLFICFRKPLLVMLSCLPPLFGLASVVAWTFASGDNLTLSGAAAMTLVIGLGADYGIVMLHELAADSSIGAFRSILVSGLTTLAGLGVLILAEHPVLYQLGSVTFFGLSAEIFAVLLLVPFLCRGKKKKVETKNG